METYVLSQLYHGGTTSPATGTPAIIAPSGGVKRIVPNGPDAPQRIPIIRWLVSEVPSNKTMSKYERDRTFTLLISSRESNVSRTSSHSFFQLRTFVNSSLRRCVKVCPVVRDPAPLSVIKI